jgi:hypothetical protein
MLKAPTPVDKRPMSENRMLAYALQIFNLRVDTDEFKAIKHTQLSELRYSFNLS